MQLVLATVGATPAPATAPDHSLVATVWDLAWKGGPVMIPIAIASLFGLAIVIERLFSLRKSRVVPPDFVAQVHAAFRDGSDRALAFCRDHPCDPGLRSKRIEEAGLRAAAGLRRNLRGLSVVVAVSPLPGLLGTIFGMIKAFRTVAQSAEALGRTELLAGGIYEAMVATAAGLTFAIPALLAYHWLAAKADSLVLDIDDACNQLADAPDLVTAPAAPQLRREPQAVALGAA